jgi:hypothetical protein
MQQNRAAIHHFIDAQKERFWNLEIKSFRGCQIDNQIKRRLPLEDTVSCGHLGNTVERWQPLMLLHFQGCTCEVGIGR